MLKLATDGFSSRFVFLKPVAVIVDHQLVEKIECVGVTKKSLRDAMLLALKMEEGTLNQRMPVASRSWKRKGNEFSPRTCAGV